LTTIVAIISLFRVVFPFKVVFMMGFLKNLVNEAVFGLMNHFFKVLLDLEFLLPIFRLRILGFRQDFIWLLKFTQFFVCFQFSL
jgi:hypothetical protein